MTTDLSTLRAAVELVTSRVGCGDNSCWFVKPTGWWATNGGCRCLERGGSKLRGRAAALAQLYKAALEATR